MNLNQPQRGVAGNHQRGEFVVTPQLPGLPHFPGGIGPVGQPVNRVDWFRRMPGGGTAFVRPAKSEEQAEQ